MRKVTSKVSNRTLQSQAREILSNLHEFKKAGPRKMEAGEVLIEIRKVQKRLAQATGVSKRVIISINKEYKVINSGDSKSFSTPHCVTPRVKNTDDFDKCVYYFYSKEKLYQVSVNFFLSMRHFFKEWKISLDKF